MKLLLCVSALVAVITADPEVLFQNANDQFRSKMFPEVANAQQGKSCVLSSFSVLSPLGQLALASVGPSHDEILKMIGFANDNDTKAVFTYVNNRLEHVEGVVLKQADKVYVKNGIDLNDQFVNISKQVFDTEVENINFSNSQQAANEINAWVEDQTGKRIKNLVDPNAIDDSTNVVLVNTIYFKGNWLKPFNPNLTEDNDFHVTKDTTIQIPMMSKTAGFNYGESADLDAKIVEMEFEGEETSFVVTLPNQIDGIDGLMEKMKDPTALNKALVNMSPQSVIVSLPKFKIETKTDLKDVLQKMNIKKLFTPGEAHLDNLVKGTDNLYINGAFQKTILEVNEWGAEAASGNIFVVVGASNDYREFKADHPFLFFIKQKGIVLFSGLFRP